MPSENKSGDRAGESFPVYGYLNRVLKSCESVPVWNRDSLIVMVVSSYQLTPEAGILLVKAEK